MRRLYTYLAGIIMVSVSLTLIVLLFMKSLIALASGRMSWIEISTHVTTTASHIVILTVVLCIGLLLLCISEGKAKSTGNRS